MASGGKGRRGGGGIQNFPVQGPPYREILEITPFQESKLKIQMWKGTYDLSHGNTTSGSWLTPCFIVHYKEDVGYIESFKLLKLLGTNHALDVFFVHKLSPIPKFVLVYKPIEADFLHLYDSDSSAFLGSRQDWNKHFVDKYIPIFKYLFEAYIVMRGKSFNHGNLLYGVAVMENFEVRLYNAGGMLVDGVVLFNLFKKMFQKKPVRELIRSIEAKACKARVYPMRRKRNFGVVWYKNRLGS